MKTVLKKGLIVLTAFVLSAALGACGGGSGAADEAQAGGVVGKWTGDAAGFETTYIFRPDGSGHYEAKDFDAFDIVYVVQDDMLTMYNAQDQSVIDTFKWSVSKKALTMTSKSGEGTEYTYKYMGEPDATPNGAVLPADLLAGTDEDSGTEGPDYTNDCIDTDGDWKGIVTFSNAQDKSASLNGLSTAAVMRVSMLDDNTGKCFIAIAVKPYQEFLMTPSFDGGDNFTLTGCTIGGSEMTDMIFTTDTNGLLTSTTHVTNSYGDFDMTFYFCRWEEKWPGTGDLAFSDSISNLFDGSTLPEVVENDVIKGDASAIPDLVEDMGGGTAQGGEEASQPEAQQGSDASAELKQVLAAWKPSADLSSIAGCCSGITDAVSSAGVALEQNISYIYDPQDGSVLRLGYMDTSKKFPDRDYVIMNSEVGLIVENYGASYNK